MAKKIFPLGLITAIAEGVPALIGIVKPFIKKKKIPDNVLEGKPQEQLVEIVKELQSHDDETWWSFILKRATTIATVYFIVWLSAKMGVTREDIMNLFGLMK